MSRPLRFLHLTTFYPPYSFGGDAMYLYRLCHALGEAGHEVDVVHCVDSYRLLHPDEPQIRFSGHPNVTTHEIRTGHTLLSPLLSHQTGHPFLKRRRIKALLESKAFDVIHFHNISLLGPGVLTLPDSEDRAVKLYTTHEHWLICPLHVLWKFGSRPCEKPECFRCTLRAGRPPQLWRHTDLLNEASRHVDRFVSPSRFTAAMHRERGFPAPVGHLPYFIDRVDDDWKRPAPRPQEAPYFLFVGRLEVIKGLQTLIDAWDRMPDYDLLVVGTGTHEAELRARAAGNPRIKFMGQLPQGALGALYHHAVACLVPSLTYETFGIVLIEAFARKTPVIARALGGLSEVVEESGGGLLFQDENELVAALRRLASSRATRDELGERGYRAFLENWSKEAHLRLYFELLTSAARAKLGAVPWEEAETDQAAPRPLRVGAALTARAS